MGNLKTARDENDCTQMMERIQLTSITSNPDLSSFLLEIIVSYRLEPMKPLATELEKRRMRNWMTMTDL